MPEKSNKGTVSVRLPAYNASKTINETLLSVRRQNYSNLEIIAVDDGSTDQTAQIINKHAAYDDRIRLIKQANLGVANARNKALFEASGDFVAPIDADDLWHPNKIAQQMALARERGPKISLIYTWYATIDTSSRIVQIRKPSDEGYVLPALFLSNFVGQASSPLMPRQQVIKVGGYDPSLRARRAQGCEDWQLYMKLAELGEFAVAKSLLTGYRGTEQSMSSDIAQMLRSHALIMEPFHRSYPQYKKEFRAGLNRFNYIYLRHALNASNHMFALIMFIKVSLVDPWLSVYSTIFIFTIFDTR